MSSEGVLPKKKITFVYTQMVMGGAEKALIRLVRAIDKNRYDVNVMLTKHGGELESELAAIVPVDYCEEITLGENLRRLHLAQLAKGIANRVRIRLAKTYEEESYWAAKCTSSPKCMSEDCVVVFNHYNYQSICIAARSNARSKIFWVHMGFRENMNYWMYDKALERFDKVFCASGGGQLNFCELFPRHASKSDVLHNMVDANEIRRLALAEVPEMLSHPMVCTVGRLSREKGLLMVPAIVRHLLDAGQGVHWYIVGEGPLRAELEAEIALQGVDENVHLLGNRENPFPYMAACDVYVQPSYDEGYCTTTNEARVLAKPIVATDIMGMNEQFEDGVTGVLCEPTVEALCDAVIDLLRSPEKCAKLSANLRNVDYSGEAELEKLYAVIERMAEC